MIKSVFLNKTKTTPPPPPPPGIFFLHQIFLNVGNSIKREENMKYWKQNSYKIQTTFHQYQNYTAHPHDMVHVPAKF